MSVSLNNDNADYSFYLGPDYKKTMKEYKKPSTLVANHCSWLDGFILGYYMFPALAVSAEFEKEPIVRLLINLVDGIYLPRLGSEKSKEESLEIIKER